MRKRMTCLNALPLIQSTDSEFEETARENFGRIEGVDFGREVAMYRQKLIAESRMSGESSWYSKINERLLKRRVEGANRFRVVDSAVAPHYGQFPGWSFLPVPCC